MAIKQVFNPLSGQFDEISQVTIGTANGLSITQNQTLSLAQATSSNPGAVANIGSALGVATLDASGLIPVTQIPPAALERLVIVADQTARFALTTATVQNGDTVLQTDTGVMYFVKDDTNLNNSSGYAIYAAGTAASVAWGGITSIPAPVSSLLGTNTGDVTLAAVGSTANANAATLAGQVLNLQPADSSFPGVVTTGTQTFSGNKTFAAQITGSVSGTAANVTGIVTIANGGTSATTSVTAFDNLAPTTTKGDLIVHSATINDRLPVGADTFVLTADSTQALGVKWAAAPTGIINYTPLNAESGTTTGLNLYNNAAQNIPNTSVSNSGSGNAGSGVLASGGTAGNLTLTNSSSAPLLGTNSYLLTKSAANAQGEGVGIPLTIDSAYQAATLGISFNYNASSGTVVSDGTTTPLNDGTTSTNAGNSDVEFFVVDVTNGQLLFVTPQVITAKGAGNYTFNGSFQTASNSSSYILAMHVATASTTAWTFKFDNVAVGPSVGSAGGTVVTDWNTNLTFGLGTGPGTVTNSRQFSRRVGDSMQVRVEYTTGALVVGQPIEVILPSGYTIDYAKASTLTSSYVGTFSYMSEGSASPTRGAFLDGSSNAVFAPNGAGSTQTSFAKATYATDLMSAGDSATWEFTVPITGWSSGSGGSSTSSSSGAVVAAQVYGNGSDISCSASVPIIMPNVSYDTSGAYNPATGQFTCPVSGFYKVTEIGASRTSPNANATLNVYKNGVVSAILGSLNNTYFESNSVEVKATAGDTLEVRPDRAMAIVGSPDITGGVMCFELLSGGSSTTAAGGGGAVNARYFSASSAITSSLATVLYTTMSFDTNSAYNPSTGIYTVPVSGKYQFNASLATTGTISLNNVMDLQVQQSGSSSQISEVKAYAGGAVTAMNANVGDIFNCVAGDTLKVQVSNSSIVPTIVSSTSQNWFSIAKVG